jgi:hypothetical protein
MTRSRAPLLLIASLACAVPLLLAPVSAAAADSSVGSMGSMGQDEVTLKDGGTVRGTVVSSQPGVGVKIIELGQTETRMIPWAEIGDVERGKFAPKPAAVQPGSAGPGYYPQPAPVAVLAAPRTPVRLHVSSPEPANVFSHRMSYGAINGYGFMLDAATPVCSAPCDQVFDASSGDTYTVKGDFNSSPKFSLAGRQGDVELAVTPGSRGLRAGGLVLVVMGGVGVITGGSLLLAGALVSNNSTTYSYPTGDSSQTDSGTGWLIPAGAAIGGVGLAMIVGGIVAIVSSKTAIDLHPMAGTAQGATAVAPRYWMGEF